MRLFCGLDIFSSSNAELPSGFLKQEFVRNVSFVDRGTREFVEHRRHVRTKLGLLEAPIARYHWRLCSDGIVESDDVEDHLNWIFSAVQPSKPLFEHLASGYDDYVLSLAWSGPGLGQGPVINVAVANLLSRHQVRLDVNFYSDEFE